MRVPQPESTYPPIADYAVIGDCRTAALVSRGGSIDWLCLPRFDSPSIFGALLDRERGGLFSVRPRGESTIERRYIGETNVLETTFTTERGQMTLVDLMPVATEAEKRRTLWPSHHVLRIVECVEGEVEVEVRCDPRPRYGRLEGRLSKRGALGWGWGEGRDALLLHSDLPLDASAQGRAVRGIETLRAGERRCLSLVYAHGEPAVLRMLPELAEREVRSTLGWWQDWASRCRYDGPYRADVVRSALTLKLLTYAPSGAVVAALTTSLPEAIGGSRNWDYRYCWLRDASTTLQSLLDLGYRKEAEAFLSWVLHSTRLTWPELQVLYDVHGESRVPEQRLDHLEGYAGSKPVRVGNAAHGQLQLDTYGEVADAVFQYVRRGGRLDRGTARLLRGLGKTVCRRWRETDEGIWEIRADRRHHTHSKAMCWVALDRLVKLHEAQHLKVPVERFEAEKRAIHEEVERHGVDEASGSYVAAFGETWVDASLLLLGRYGFADPGSERMRATCARVLRELGENGLLYRYRSPDGLPPGEGAFGICSFWAVDCHCRQGRLELAEETFERICGMSNDLGLFAEELDPRTGEHLGNFPQAFTHAGLIDSAITLQEAAGGPTGAEAKKLEGETPEEEA